MTTVCSKGLHDMKSPSVVDEPVTDDTELDIPSSGSTAPLVADKCFQFNYLIPSIGQ